MAESSLPLVLIHSYELLSFIKLHQGDNPEFKFFEKEIQKCIEEISVHICDMLSQDNWITDDEHNYQLKLLG